MKTSKALLRLELAAYIIRKSIASFGKSIVQVFLPAVDRRAGGSFSFVIHTILAIITLEGPRLLLMSRYRAARMKKGTKVGLSAISGTAVAAIIMASLLIGSQLIAVTVDGKVIGYVENEEQYTSLLQRAREKISKQAGTEDSEIMISDTGISLETVHAPQQLAMTPTAETPVSESERSESIANEVTDSIPVDNVTPSSPSSPVSAFLSVIGVKPSESPDPAVGEEALVDSLVDSLIDGEAVKATFYTITINGRDLATLSSMKEASDILKAVTIYYAPPEEDFSGKFIDDVAINCITANLGEITPQNPKDVIDFLIAGATMEQVYTTIEGDSIADICDALGITEIELHNNYPDYDFDNLTEGDEFVTKFNIPYINYQTEGTEVVSEEIPYITIEEKTNSIYLGQREIKEEGVPGERVVTRSVTRINGEIVSSSELSSELVVEAQPEIVSVGTLTIMYGDAYVGPSDGFGGGGDGPLGRPLNSWYLSRSIQPGHNGADMCAPRGSPIFAAAYGVVSFAGVYGSYGNLVIIDHGNGLQTYYAHCDTFNTVAGAAVQKGQQIATVGTTGRSTAYHLHFEVRVNGVVQEPLNWIG